MPPLLAATSDTTTHTPHTSNPAASACRPRCSATKVVAPTPATHRFSARRLHWGCSSRNRSRATKAPTTTATQPASHLHHAAHAGVVVVDDRRHRKGCPGGMQNKRCILTRSGDESQSTPQSWRGYATRERGGHWEPGEPAAGPPAPALNSAGEARLANCAGRWSRPRAPAGAAG